MELGVEGRVALVLGASRGLGQAIATVLAREGAAVAIASRSKERIEQAAAEIGDRAHAFVADTGDLTRMPALVADVEQTLGSVEILVTNTGGPPPGQTLGVGTAEWEAAYRSLVLAPLALVEAVVPGMRERQWGRIVNVTSISTKEPIPGLALSNAHRLAAVGLFKTLSRELAADGISVNSVAPGRVATARLAELYGTPVEELEAAPHPDIPMGRLGKPEEFAAAVAFLCSEPASYLTGVNLMVDGGLTAGI